MKLLFALLRRKINISLKLIKAFLVTDFLKTAQRVSSVLARSTKLEFGRQTLSKKLFVYLNVFDFLS